MSLSVNIITKDNNGYDTEQLERLIPEPNNLLFGTEVWRKLVWGHEIMLELGCSRIYSLRETNVCAYDEEVQQLKYEFETIIENIEEVTAATGALQTDVAFRIGNALEAIKIVEQHLDEVGIALW